MRKANIEIAAFQSPSSSAVACAKLAGVPASTFNRLPPSALGSWASDLLSSNYGLTQIDSELYIYSEQSEQTAAVDLPLTSLRSLTLIETFESLHLSEFVMPRVSCGPSIWPCTPEHSMESVLS